MASAPADTKASCPDSSITTACRRRSGIRLNIDCETCGAEDELHSGGRCWPCVLGNVVDDLLTDPATGSITNDLIPLAAALKSMKRANIGLTWIRQKHVTVFLGNLAVAPKITHETFDELPDSRTRDYVRGLLTEHGVLPPMRRTPDTLRQLGGRSLRTREGPSKP